MSMRLVKYFFFLCGLLVLSLTGLYFNQEWMMMRYTPLPQEFTYPFAEKHEELFFDREDGGRVNALLYTVENPKGVVLYVHGRGGNMEYPWGKVHKDFSRRGYNTLIFDYRGFGKSTGAMTQDAFLSDALCAYDYLHERYPDKPMVVYGVSFGSGIATYVASKRPATTLILEAPYYSMIDLIPRLGYMIPQWILKIIIKFPLYSHDWIQGVGCPIYIFHGKLDELIPYNSSERLLKHVKSHVPAALITLKNGKHNYLSRHPVYQKTLDQILHKSSGSNLSAERGGEDSQTLHDEG